MIGGTARSRPLEWRAVNWFLMAAILVAVIDVGMWYVGIRAGMVLWPEPGIDFATYQQAAQSWLAGTGFYLPYQFAPFDVWQARPQPVMYPPTAAPIFAVLTAIPVIWWVAPFAIVAYRLRGWERWALVAALLLWPGSVYSIATGNPGLWIMAALSLGVGSVIVLKPTLAPFALVGVRTGRWWIVAGAIALGSLALLPMWVDYLAVLRNARGTDLWYSFWQFPLIAIGLIRPSSSGSRGGSVTAP